MEKYPENKRSKIIAALACSMIFLFVLIITVATISRSSRPVSPRRIQVPPPPPLPGQTVPDPQPGRPIPPPEVTVATYGNFDTSTRQELPARFKKYNFSAGILVDLTNRKILWAKNENRVLPIASISKLMTVYTAFEVMKQQPDIKLNTMITVSRECTLQAPVKAPLTPGDKISLNDLFKYSMLKSANDASYLLAEYFGNGDVRVFIEMMNSQARSIGMNSSNFVNANGLPIYRGQSDRNALMNTSSCMDLILLMERIVQQPQIMRYAGTTKAKIRHHEINNGNSLIGTVPGMNGMKTGYTRAAGYCLAFSCERNGRMLIGVVLGCPGSRERSAFVRNLLEWGFMN